MEYGLIQMLFIMYVFSICLNPCCNGIWANTNAKYVGGIPDIPVLILVVMEYGLIRWKTSTSIGTSNSLNPCCNGIWANTGLPVNWQPT